MFEIIFASKKYLVFRKNVEVSLHVKNCKETDVEPLKRQQVY